MRRGRSTAGVPRRVKGRRQLRERYVDPSLLLVLSDVIRFLRPERTEVLLLFRANFRPIGIFTARSARENSLSALRLKIATPPRIFDLNRASFFISNGSTDTVAEG